MSFPRVYFKFVLWLAVLAVFIILWNAIHVSNGPISLYYPKTTIHSTQNVLMAIVLILAFIIYYTVLQIHKIIYTFIHIEDFMVRIWHGIRAAVGFKIKTEDDVMTKIRSMIKRKLYKKALQTTRANYKNGGEFLYNHLLCLLKTGRKMEFYRTFSQYHNGRSIPLFLFAIKKLPSWQRNMKINSMYKANPKNPVFGYLKALTLLRGENPNINEASRIIRSFLEVNPAFINDPYCAFKFNLLALEIERIENDSLDFASKYIENINSYRYAFVQKKA